MSSSQPHTPTNLQAAELSSSEDKAALQHHEHAVIEVNGVSKRFEIYPNAQDRLKELALSGLLNSVLSAVGKKRTHFYEEFWALKEISFAIVRGQTVGIIGRNGSGKSTLLQIIAGTLAPTQGSAQAHGKVAALLELGSGFNPDFTGIENVFLNASLYGLSQKQTQDRLQDIIAFADIGDFVHQPVRTYSSGMVVRLAFAVIAHVDADVLIVDEALSVGDVRFTQKCMRFLREFQQRGTLLFVSHDSSAVVTLCDRAIWLDQGVIQADGNAKEVVELYMAAQHAADRASKGIVVHLNPALAKATQSPATQAKQANSAPAIARSSFAAVFESFEFNANEIEHRSIGAGDIQVVSAKLTSHQQEHVFEGGELVKLSIGLQCKVDVGPVIVGFFVKNRLGQQLFGDNTYQMYRDRPVYAVAGQTFETEFVFQMPILAAGPHTIDIAVASGTLEDHTQQHWVHDAVEFRATNTNMTHGLVGIPMQSIHMKGIE